MENWKYQLSGKLGDLMLNIRADESDEFEHRVNGFLGAGAHDTLSEKFGQALGLTGGAPAPAADPMANAVNQFQQQLGATSVAQDGPPSFVPQQYQQQMTPPQQWQQSQQQWGARPQGGMKFDPNTPQFGHGVMCNHGEMKRVTAKDGSWSKYYCPIGKQPGACPGRPVQ